GLVAGLAVTGEYPMVVVLGFLAVYALVRERLRAAWFALGAIPPLAGLAAYQWIAFGSPFTQSYRYTVTPQNQGELGGVDHFDFGVIERTLFGDRGLLLITPLVLVGL